MKYEIKLPFFYPDPHRHKIEQHFQKQGARHTPEGEEVPMPTLDGTRIFYFICFTNRCGSNLLAESIASDQKLVRAGEFLNQDVVIKTCKRLNLPNIESYVDWLAERFAGNRNTAGVKAAAGQLLFLNNIGILDRLGRRLRCIHIVRRDVIDQAVSMHIATMTHKWTSLHPDSEAQVEYDRDSILGHAYAITRANSAFSLLFKLLRVEPLVVEYEDLVEDPAGNVERVGEYLGMPGLKYVPEQMTLEKQADELNWNFRQRFLDEVSLPEPVPRKRQAQADKPSRSGQARKNKAHKQKAPAE
jgi:LPS sulfotransferase NodH